MEQQPTTFSGRVYDAFSYAPPPGFAPRLERIDAAAKNLAGLSAAPSDDVEDCLEDLNREFMARFSYHTTSLEGSTLSLPDTELVIEGEFVPKDEKEVKDLFAAKGAYEGFLYAIAQLARGREIDEDFVKDVHERTALDIQPRNRGVYRVSPVFITNSLAVTADVYKIRPLMKDLFAAYGASKQHPIVRAAAFHAMFENIHPFRDGNGRCGRTVMNAMLMQAGYPPISIRSGDAGAYAKALEDWQVRAEPLHLVETVCSSIEAETAKRTDALEKTIFLLPELESERLERRTQRVRELKGGGTEGLKAFLPPQLGLGTTPKSIRDGFDR